MHQEEQYAVRVIRAGASGYLSKEGDSDLIVPAVRKVAQGGVFISPKVAELLALDTLLNVQNPSHTSLSDREFDVFFRIVRGESLTNIANSLSLSVKTVSTHKSHILHKMCMSKDVDLVRYAVEHNLLDPLN
jgi:DNA-binding NarL/FixJ family response regulator